MSLDLGEYRERLEEVLERIPDKDRAATAAAVKGLGEYLLKLADSDSFAAPAPTGNVLDDAANLAGAAANSVRSKVAERRAAVGYLKAIARIVLKSLAAGAVAI